MGIETINTAIFGLALLFMILGLGLMIMRGLIGRHDDRIDTMYSVGQIKSRQVRFREGLAGFMVFLVGLLLMAVWGLLTSGSWVSWIVDQATSRESAPTVPAAVVEYGTVTSVASPVAVSDVPDPATETPTLPTPIPDNPSNDPTQTATIEDSEDVATSSPIPPPTSVPTEIPASSTDIVSNTTTAPETTNTADPTALPALPSPSVLVEGEPKLIPTAAKVNSAFVNVRIEPNGELLATLAKSDDELLGVLDGEIEIGGYVWREVETWAGVGWIVEDYLTLVYD